MVDRNSVQVIPPLAVARPLTDDVAVDDAVQGAVQQLIAACDNSVSYCSDIANWGRRQSRTGWQRSPDRTELAMMARDLEKTIELLRDARDRMMRSAAGAPTSGKPAVALT